MWFHMICGGMSGWESKDVRRCKEDGGGGWVGGVMRGGMVCGGV